MTNVGESVIGQADRLAELATGFAEPSLELVEERTRPMRTEVVALMRTLDIREV